MLVCGLFGLGSLVVRLIFAWFRVLAAGGLIVLLWLVLSWF